MSMIIHTKYLPDIDVDTSSFIYEDDYILIQDEYICDVLKCMNVPEIVDGNFYDICDRGCCFEDYPEVLESYALKSVQYAYYYARKVLEGRFELAEPNIATNAEYSYGYARDVLKGRFELGEKAIATSAGMSFRYAFDVIQGRFELGEKAIASNAMYSYRYARNVVEGRFELGEHAILNSIYDDEYRDKFLCQ